MIQRIRRHFSDRSVIEDGVSHTIYEENSEVIIEAHRSEPNLSIQTDDGEISVESGTNTFNKSYLESVNATVTKFDNTLVSYGSVYEEFELYISLTSDQLSELTDLKLRGESDLLNPTSEPSISTVLKCGNMYTLTVSNFPKNCRRSVHIDFSHLYPDIRLDGSIYDYQNLSIDVSILQPREIMYTVDLSSELKSDQFGSFSTITSEDGCSILGLDKKMYFAGSDIADRIYESDFMEWNTQTISFSIRPENYAPVSFEKQLVEKTTVISESEFELKPCGTVTVQFPEWVVKKTPEIRYDHENLSYDSTYTAVEKVDTHTYRFTNVIPDLQFSIYNDTSFEFDKLSYGPFAIDPYESLEIGIPLRMDCYKSFYINPVSNHTNRKYVCKINDDLEKISSKTLFTAKSTEPVDILIRTVENGDVIYSNTFSRSEIASVQSINILDQDITITSATDEPTIVKDHSFN